MTDIQYVPRSIHPPKGFWAIEVKRSANLGPDDIRSMQAFQEEYPEAKCAFVIPTNRRENYRNFSILPMEEFLLNIRLDQPLPI